jgi:hypothetical protein
MAGLGPDRVVGVAAADAEQRRGLDYGEDGRKMADLVRGQRGVHDWVPLRVVNDVLRGGRAEHEES